MGGELSNADVEVCLIVLNEEKMWLEMLVVRVTAIVKGMKQMDHYQKKNPKKSTMITLIKYIMIKYYRGKMIRMRMQKKQKGC